MITWKPTDIPELSYAKIAGIRVEKLVTQKGNRFSIGEMEKALIKFQDEKQLIKYLTV